MKKLVFLLFCLPIITSAQNKDLIVTNEKDSIYCTILKVDKSIITYEIENNQPLTIRKKDTKHHFQNTYSKVTHCDNGYIIKKDGLRVKGKLFINTNSYGVQSARRFYNEISSVSLQNPQTKQTVSYYANEIQGFYYCDTMYMSIKSVDSTHQFVCIISSGKKVILAKGINPTRTANVKEFLASKPRQSTIVEISENAKSGAINMESVQPIWKKKERIPEGEQGFVKSGTFEVSVRKNMAKDAYFIITRNKAPIMTSKREFYDDLVSLFEAVGETLDGNINWNEKSMMAAIKYVNEELKED